VEGAVGLGRQLTALEPEDHGFTDGLHDTGSGLVIAADARIDHRDELCAALGIALPEGRLLSPGRLILAAWQKWGRGCPRHLVGDYAFAIWDPRRHTMFCARDHIGARAFYYSLTPDLLAFATDIKALLTVPGISDQLDEEYVTASLADKRFYRKDRTYFRAIQRLAPGHSLTVEPATARLERYWTPETCPDIRFSDDRDYAQAAREIYEAAIRDRMKTNRRVGVHLSGGLDSSSVTSLVARERRRRGDELPLVFSGQPEPDDAARATREYSQIEAVCAREQLHPIYCPPDPRDILSVLSKDPAREPVHTTLRVEVTIQRVAAEHGVRLLLAGWGGDEGLSFDGRGYYSQMLLRGRLRPVLEEGRRSGSPWRFVAKEAALLLFADRNEGLKKIASRSLRSRPVGASFLNPELRSRVRLHKIPCRQASIRSTMFWLWDRGCLAERMEAWAAHGASHGITYAYPLLDRRLLEFLAGLPPEQFLRDKWRRWLIRRSMEGILPDEVCWQPDKAEPVRFDHGLRAAHDAIALARERLAASRTKPSRARYLDMPRLLERMHPEHLARNPKPGDIFRALQFLDF
jgi:asparagine synthase (glutamine-hydrolysing)